MLERLTEVDIKDLATLPAVQWFHWLHMFMSTKTLSDFLEFLWISRSADQPLYVWECYFMTTSCSCNVWWPATLTVHDCDSDCHFDSSIKYQVSHVKVFSLTSKSFPKAPDSDSVSRSFQRFFTDSSWQHAVAVMTHTEHGNFKLQSGNQQSGLVFVSTWCYRILSTCLMQD